MAAVTVQVFVSPREGSSVSFNYDNASLLLTSVTITGGQNPANPLLFWCDDGTTLTTLQAGQGVSGIVHAFGSPIKGTKSTNPQGKTIINWFVRYGAGHAVVPLGPVTTL